MFFDGRTTKRKQVNYGGRQTRGRPNDRWRSKTKEKQKRRIEEMRHVKPAMVIQATYRRVKAERKLRLLASERLSESSNLDELQKFLFAFDASETHQEILGNILGTFFSKGESELSFFLKNNLKRKQSIMFLSLGLRYHFRPELMNSYLKVFQLFQEETKSFSRSFLEGEEIHFLGLSLPQAIYNIISSSQISIDHSLYFKLLTLTFTIGTEQTSELALFWLLRINLFSDVGKKFLDLLSQDDELLLSFITRAQVGLSNFFDVVKKKYKRHVAFKISVNSLYLMQQLEFTNDELWKLLLIAFTELPSLIDTINKSLEVQFEYCALNNLLYKRSRNYYRGSEANSFNNDPIGFSFSIEKQDILEFSELLQIFLSQDFVFSNIAKSGIVSLPMVEVLERIRKQHIDIDNFSSPYFKVVGMISSSRQDILRDLWIATLQYENTMAFMFSCTCLLLFLRGCDEEKVFREENPFTLSLLEEITIGIKMFLYQKLWIEEIRRTDELRDVISLFNLLQEKSTRHKFIATEQWLFPVIEIKKAINLNQVRNSSHPDEVEDDSDLEYEEEILKMDIASKLKIVLIKIPHVVSFEQRTSLFYDFLDREYGMDNFFRGAEEINIRRNHVFEDAFSQLENRSQINFKVVFIDADDLREAGIDGGGLFKEFMTLLLKEIFVYESDNASLWKTTANQEVYPSGEKRASTSLALRKIKFAGAMLGKAVAKGIVLAPRFAPFFFNSLVGKLNKFDDLFAYDVEIYRNLVTLRKMENQELASLDLMFEWTTPDRQCILLKKGGDKIPVTESNKFEYITRVSHFLINKQFSKQIRAFADGFKSVIPGTWVQMFSADELHLLFGGSSDGYNIDDLKRHAQYSQGYFTDDTYIQWFWEILKECNQKQRANFLSFVTSCPRPPLRGFGALNPKFCIQEVHRIENLPTASTCVNLLKLPRYGSKEVLKEKLLYAIQHNEGFQRS